MWKQNLGVDIGLNNKEWKTYLQDVDTLNYEIARAGWIGDFNDPMTFLDMWMTDNGNNDTGWSNAEYDGLIKQAQQTVDTKARAEILQRAEKLLLEQGPVIPIYIYTNNTLISRFVKGFEPHNRDIHLLKYFELEK
jgi:oligopeptide transport system substrate-binding protein